MLEKLLNYGLLQGGWFICVLGVAWGDPWIGPMAIGIILAYHFWRSRDRRREILFVALAGGMGLLVDSLQKVGGLINYHHDTLAIPWLAPLYIVSLWMLYASTFTSSMDWMRRSYALAIAAGAVFGPLSYLAGQRLGAISFAYGQEMTLGILAVVWGAANPILVLVSNRIFSPPVVSRPLHVPAGTGLAD
ncbi:MAG: DUF2878 domain-containing protein [Acidobacteria bacterium]|nr:DUF2878 domain-containing protein [Acidobacteriota bacterium]